MAALYNALWYPALPLALIAGGGLDAVNRRERLGSAVSDVVFDRDRMQFPALSLKNYRTAIERTAGPMLKLAEMLSASDPGRLAQFRREYEALAAPYFEDNVLRQDYLLTRALKR